MADTKIGLLKQILLLVGGSVALGAAFGFWFMPRWVQYVAPDEAFFCEFRQKPVNMGFPKPVEYVFVKDDSLKIYTLKWDLGIDEINRLDVLESPNANQEWFEKTIAQTKGSLIKGDADDFSVKLPSDEIYLRGRIVYAPGGKGIYKIFVVRGSAEELESLDSERFLYGLKFAP